MLIFLLSLARIPPTAGFLGKYYIFLALIQTKHYTLAVVATLYVAVAIYYYFKIVKTMFIREAEEKAPPLATTVGLKFALAASVVLTLAIGIYPQPFLEMAKTSARRLTTVATNSSGCRAAYFGSFDETVLMSTNAHGMRY